MIFFRTDGNSDIGMGHIMRCLSIAKACKSKKIEVAFITATKECVKVIEDQGIKDYILETNYKEMESEIQPLQALLADKNKKDTVILIDSYQMTNKYVEELKQLGHVVCLDDLGNTYPADMLINYNMYAESLDYDYKDNQKPKLILGPKYAPLRDEFLNKEAYEVREEAKKVMLTTGGSDPKNATAGLLNAFLRNGLLNRKGIEYHVIIGPLNPFSDALKKEFGKNPQVVLHEKVTNMSEIMEDCDVLVTTTGSTVYEACAIGIPMIAFYYADNQQQIAEYLDKNTDVFNCGNYSQMAQMVCFNACDALVRCVMGKDTRRELNEQERNIVDGKGAMRITEELMSF